MDAILIISLFLLGNIWFTIYYCLNKFLMFKNMFKNISTYRTGQNMYVQVTDRNLMFCTYVLHKRHGQFFGAHSRNFFLNSIGDTIFFNSVGKMSHIFGPKLDIVSEPCMTALILLPCSVVLFLRLYVLYLRGNIPVYISSAMLFFTSSISYATVCKLR